MVIFAEKVWVNFDFEYVITKLLDDKPHNHYRKVLYEALVAWVVAPHCSQIRQAAIMMKANMLVSNFEKDLINKSKSDFDYFRRHKKLVKNRLGKKFYENIYYPIGGMAAFQNSISEDQYYRNLIKGHKKHILGVIKVLELLHYHSLHFTNEKNYHAPSLKRCESALMAIHKADSFQPKYNNYKSIQPELTKRVEVACLYYASKKVIINRNNNNRFTLFDSFFTPSSKFKFEKSYIEEWLWQANFIQLNLINKLKAKKLLLRDVETLNFVLGRKECKPPILEDVEIEAITKSAMKENCDIYNN